MASRPPDNEIMGLYTWIPASPAEPDKAVDIIAVQGLGASPYYTWIKNVPKAGGGVEEVMWLRDLLPQFVPKARIATFSYHSDWYTYKKGFKTSIRELGEQLLMVLHHDRQRIKASRRPIVFIGHSMGGLVIKQALVHASNRADCEDIRSSTAGAIFLGTPHEGSDIAGWATYLAMIKGNDSNLLEQLKPRAEMLYHLSHDFASGYKHLSIVCFYEKLDNTYLGGKLKVPIVDQRSAVQVGQGIMFLIADHSGLNKFPGVDDANFKLVLTSSRPNPLFTGRIVELDKLRMALCLSTPKEKQSTEANVYVLYGMGGAGKSEVVLKFVYENRSEFWGIFWIDARSESSIATGFVDVARRCGLDESVNDAISWLQDTLQPWLLILDNADDPEFNLSPYLPSGLNGSILITSRIPDARQYENAGYDCYERLEEETAVELLFKSCRIDKESRVELEHIAHAIADLLGCHALAVVQAGAAISHGICKMEEYKSMFLSQRRALLEYLPQAKSEYGDVYTTLEVSAKYLEGRNDQIAKDALRLLDFHAFMHFSDFPEEAFIEAWKNSQDMSIVVSNLLPSDEKKIYKLDPWHRSNLPTFMRRNLYTEGLDVISLRKARHQLESLSLITIDASKEMTRIHPVTHAWSRDRLKDPESVGAWFNAIAVLSLSIRKPDHYQPVIQLLQPHLESMAKRPSYYDLYKDIFSIHQSFYRLAYALSRRLRSDSQAYEMLQLIPKRINDAWIRTSSGQQIQLLQARIIMRFGDLEDSKVLMEEITKANTYSSKAESGLQTRVQQVLAEVYQKLGQESEAIELLQRVVEFRFKRSGNAAERHTLNAQYDLGTVYLNKGDLEKARTILEQVVNLGRRTLQAEDLHQLSAEHELARVCYKQEVIVEATRIFEQVVQKKSKQLKPNDLSRLRSEYMLAQCYYQSGNCEQSLRLAKSIEDLAQRFSSKRLADGNKRLIRKCLEAMKLEETSSGDESRQEEVVNEDEKRGLRRG